MIKRLFRYINYWREVYLFVPLAMGSLWGHQWLYASLMGGREAVDPPVDLVHASRQLYFLFVVGAVVGLFQKHLFGYRSKEAGASLADDFYDACITVFLFLFVAHSLR